MILTSIVLLQQVSLLLSILMIIVEIASRTLLQRAGHSSHNSKHMNSNSSRRSNSSSSSKGSGRTSRNRRETMRCNANKPK